MSARPAVGATCQAGAVLGRRKGEDDVRDHEGGRRGAGSAGADGADGAGPTGGRASDLRFLFVVTYARSGSTLLQGVLNSIPGYLIRGENMGVLDHLAAFDAAASHRRRGERARQRRDGLPVGHSEPTHPFFGLDGYPRAVARTEIRRLVVRTLLRPGADTRVAGFKEIRWNRPDLPEHLAWIAEVFPGARFVVNTRDLDDAARSRIWREKEDAAEQLAQAHARLIAALPGLGDAGFHLHYDDWSQDAARLRPFFDWLGEPFDEDAVRAVMAVRHSY